MRKVKSRATYYVPGTELSTLWILASFKLHNHSVICTHFADEKHEGFVSCPKLLHTMWLVRDNAGIWTQFLWACGLTSMLCCFTLWFQFSMVDYQMKLAGHPARQANSLCLHVMSQRHGIPGCRCRFLFTRLWRSLGLTDALGCLNSGWSLHAKREPNLNWWGSITSPCFLSVSLPEMKISLLGPQKDALGY